MSYPVKWFNSKMAGSPQVGPPKGSVVAWFDACLIDGFNLQSLTGLTYDSASGEIVATTASGHGYLQHQVVLLSGANETEYNGEFRVVRAESTTFYLAPNATPLVNQATGTLQAKTAPIGGWEKLNANADNSLSQYRSTAPAATGCILQIDDTHTHARYDANGANARVACAEDVLSDGTLVNPWGDPEHDVICKAYSTSFDTGFGAWNLVGDSQFVYLTTDQYDQDLRNENPDDPNYDPLEHYTPAMHCFGDVPSFRPADAFNCVALWGDPVTSPRDAKTEFDMVENHEFRIARPEHQELSERTATHVSLEGSSICSEFAALSPIPYPNPADNGLYIHYPVLIEEYQDGRTENLLRGRMPGLYHILNEQPRWGREAFISNVAGYDDVLFYAVGTCYGGQTGYTYRAYPLLDITGPWR